jgi:gluconate 5-dehydrogenase
MSSLSGKTALITGASRGIGRATAVRHARDGAKIAVNFKGNAAAAEETKALVEGAGSSATLVQGDVSAEADADRVVKEALAFGGGKLEILVNNAGTTWGANVLEHPMDAWKKVLDLNLTAMFVASQEVGRRCMVPRRKGKIVNIASILGLIGSNDNARPGTIAYNTSKGGVISFTRSLAAEWAQYDINVNAIAPGFFPTKMTKGLMEMLGDRVASKAPLNRVGGPEDLKGVALLLSSDACRFITGQVITVDGGVTAV